MRPRRYLKHAGFNPSSIVNVIKRGTGKQGGEKKLEMIRSHVKFVGYHSPRNQQSLKDSAIQEELALFESRLDLSAVVDRLARSSRKL